MGGVVHCKKAKYHTYIGRGSMWGNPFTHLDTPTKAKFKVDSREEAIEKYEEWVKAQPALMTCLPSLKVKILGCWCSPKPCHGDVLVRLANAL